MVKAPNVQGMVSVTETKCTIFISPKQPKTAQNPRGDGGHWWKLVDIGGPGVAPGVAAMELRCRRCLG